MRKRILMGGTAMVLAAAMLAGCQGETKETAGENGAKAGEAAQSGPKDAADVKVALVVGLGGLGDMGYNDEVYSGLERAQEELGISFDYVEPKSVNDYETQFRMYADSEEYDLIIAPSVDMLDAIKLVAADYPDQRFTILDTEADGIPNLHAISAKNPEQTFLSGVIAGLVTTDERMEFANPENVIAFAIAQDTPLSRSQAAGFMAGAKYVNPEVEIITNYIGSYKDPGKAKEIALSAFGRGADVISHNAGGSGVGVFNAAAEAGRYVIGSSLATVDPKYSLCTSRKKVDEFAYQDIKAVIDGTWKAGSSQMGIAEGVCGYDRTGCEVEIPEDILEKVEKAKQAVIDGTITLPEDIDAVDAWAAENQLGE